MTYFWEFSGDPARRATLRLPRFRASFWSLAVVALCLSLFATGLQFLWAREHAFARQGSEFENLSATVETNLELAFAQRNDQMVEMLLDNFISDPDVSFVEVRLFSGRMMQFGDPALVDVLQSRGINRFEAHQEWERIGSMSAGLSHARLTDELRMQTLVSFLSNLFVSACLIVLVVTARQGHRRQ